MVPLLLLRLREVARGAEEPKSPISAAVKWELNPNTSLTFARKHQQEWGINLSSSFDTKSLPIKPIKPVFISSANIPKNDLPSNLNKNRWYDMLLYDVERAGILLLEAKSLLSLHHIKACRTTDSYSD